MTSKAAKIARSEWPSAGAELGPDLTSEHTPLQEGFEPHGESTGQNLLGPRWKTCFFFPKEPSMMIYNDVYSWSIDDLLDCVFSDFQPKKQSLPGASLILLLPFAVFWYQNKMLEYQVKQTKNRRLRDETQQLGTGDFWGVVCDLSQWFLGFF